MRELRKQYGSVTAVDGITYSVEPGLVAGFLGPNGAGKTTTLRMVGGLIRPTSGAALLFGADARRPEARRRLGYMPADPAFLPHLSGTANLDLIAHLHGAEPVDRDATAAVLDLPATDLVRRVGEYSSGMRQKLAILAALQHRPDLVILDEPANRLDPIAHRSFCGVLREVAASGRSVLLSSHVLGEVEAVCDNVILIREGRTLVAAAVDELREQASRVVTLVYRDARPRPVPAALDRATVDGRSVTGRVPADRPDLIRELIADPDVVDITVAPPSLEDIVLGYYLDAAS